MKNIGIVGFGIVGKSILKFLSNNEYQFSVWDNRSINDDERALVPDVHFFSKDDISLDDFFKQNDKICVSPGIDIRPYLKYSEKLLAELDLFASACRKKTIAITGTLGKTTITTLIHELLPYKNLCGGNIGYAMLDLIPVQDAVEWLVLEISSFQLAQNKIFAPDIAIWTNFYSNHLDWHGTLKHYFDSKWLLFDKQKSGQYGLFSVSLFDGIAGPWFEEKLKNYCGEAVFISDSIPTSSTLSKKLLQNKKIFFVDGGFCYCARVINEKIVGSELLLDLRKSSGFLGNLVFIQAVHNILGAEVNLINQKNSVIDHRCELFATIKGIDFINDSKSTVMEATIAAVKKLSQSGRPIILILGGLGKGVDRTPLCSFISGEKSIKKVFCLGDKAPEFNCYEKHSSLSDLLRATMQIAADGDQVLFSPSGTSFDMFKNFEERGDLFKRTVLEMYGER